MALQVRRGTNQKDWALRQYIGELIYVTDTKQLFVGDGDTPAALPQLLVLLTQLLADTTPQLGGNLDLNSRNITGTGNINITAQLLQAEILT